MKYAKAENLISIFILLSKKHFSYMQHSLKNIFPFIHACSLTFNEIEEALNWKNNQTTKTKKKYNKRTKTMYNRGKKDRWKQVNNKQKVE